MTNPTLWVYKTTWETSSKALVLKVWQADQMVEQRQLYFFELGDVFSLISILVDGHSLAHRFK
jgi:hypothetical protein